MTDTEWVAMWVRHCNPCAVFCHYTPTGVQYVLMPLVREPCDECHLLH